MKILAPCGMLGYGYPIESFNLGIAQQPDAIVVDAGSTDAGPHKLGAGVGIVSRYACKKDLVPMIKAALSNKIPLIIGSAGGSGARVHVEWTYDIINEILSEENIEAKVALIWADISQDTVLDSLKRNELYPMSANVPELSVERIEQTKSIVAQMGAEPIIDALSGNADIILCGRAYDPAVFAAPGIKAGFDPALCFHLGKILECGALCADPPSAKDCIMGVLQDNCFTVYPLSLNRSCTSISVAAHTFYEKDHPYILKGPGFELDLSQCAFEDVENGAVEVRGSKIRSTDNYYIKLEGARQVGWRCFTIAGIRDPLLIEALPQVQLDVKEIV